LQKIDKWLHNSDPDTPPILWLNGMAGFGKSTIAQTVAERADKEGLLGASFFFSRGESELTDPSRVLPTIAFQLAKFDQAFKDQIVAALDNDLDAGHLSLLDQLKKLIITPLASPFVGVDRPVVLIVVDALDECERSGAEKLLQFLFAHIPRLPFVRILITS
jgi:hypothetical protein